MSMRRFHSQHGEDCLLWTLFGKKNSGFFIEVGAFDGVHLSNTLSFEEQGWRGICVEPNPEYFDLCRKNRPNSICIHSAAVSDPRIREVSFFAEDLGLLSGLVRENEEDIRRRYSNRKLDFTGLREMKVPAMTLDGIMEKHLPKDAVIDFISIDVEGHEIEVLSGFDLKKYRPRVVILEANSDNIARLISDRMSGAGYRLGRNLGGNLFFAASRRDALRLDLADIDCVIEKSVHPRGLAYTAEDSRDPHSISIKQGMRKKIGLIARYLLGR